MARGLDQLLAGADTAFTLLHRPHTGPHVEVMLGRAIEARRIEQLSTSDRTLLAAIPYRQLTERGFACRDDGEPIRAIDVRTRELAPADEVLHRLPDVPIALRDGGFDLDDQSYAGIVRRVIDDEIGRGEGSNFVIRRSFTATLPGEQRAVALAVFRRLLAVETGAYWTFLVHTGDRTFIGASPERHVTLDHGDVVMNPISGTFRYPPSGPRVDDIVTFLANRKESDELYMVVDEELKMMARVCERGGRVVGPYLREMAWLAHTEYLIEGRSELDARDVLRATLLAPTVTGSPVENACRVIARHEPTPRGYYAGVLALLDRDRMDTAIMIRMAELDSSGRLTIGVGSTLVRLSDPESEADETRAKAASMLAALGFADERPRERPSTPRLDRHPAVRDALRARNTDLARFWLAPVDTRRPRRRSRLRVLMVDAEDAFTAMLEQQLRTLGLDVTACPYHSVPDPRPFSLVVLGPGPGDPTDRTDPKMVALRGMTRLLLHRRTPLLAVCLSHQLLAAELGLELRRRAVPNQGVQQTVDLFGRPEPVGFYNTFAARSAVSRFTDPYGSGDVHVGRDRDGEVFALRGKHFASVQFHPESLLTRNGAAILSELLESLIAAHRDDLVSVTS